MVKIRKTLNCIDLFSGAGGLTEGFTSSNFNIIAHVEKDFDACLTLKTRLSYHYLASLKKLEHYYAYLEGIISRDELYGFIPHEVLSSVINEEISESTFEKISDTINTKLMGKDVDIIFGGPPCQAYSLIGRSRDKNSMVKDKRKYLYREYIRYLEKFNPKIFVFENVKGLLSSKNENGNLIIDAMREEFLKAGYLFQHRVLDASNFGVIQTRRRVIIIGYKKELTIPFPIFPYTNSTMTINDLFKDLPFLNSGEEGTLYSKHQNNLTYYRNSIDLLTQHVSRKNNDRDLEIYKIAVCKANNGFGLRYIDLPERLQTHKNLHSFSDRYKVVNGNSKSHTIVAHISKDGHHFIHPDIHQNRSITVREAARIQSFPDNYYFEKSRTSAYKQIGNAVPPLMASSISQKLLDLF